MDPGLALLLGAIGQGIIQGGGAYAQAKAGFSPDAEKRLNELRRLEERNALGLSDEEKASLQTTILDPQRAIQKQRQQQQAALLGGQIESGRGLEQMMMAQQKDDEMLRQASQQIAQLDLQRKRELEKELLGLGQAEAASDAALQAGLTGLLGGGLAAYGDYAQKQKAREDAKQRRDTQTSGQIYEDFDDEDLQNLEEF